MEATHQGLNARTHLLIGVAGQVGVAGRGENRVMTQNLLHFKQVNAGFNQVGGVAVAKAVRRDLFFSPQSMAT